MNKKILSIFVLLFVLAFGTTAFASLTFTNNAITGTTASGIDMGAGNTLSLQTVGNAPITTGTGLFTLGGALRATGATFSGLTSGRIPLVSTGGSIIDGIALTYSGTTAFGRLIFGGGPGIRYTSQNMLGITKQNSTVAGSGQLATNGILVYDEPDFVYPILIQSLANTLDTNTKGGITIPVAAGYYWGTPIANLGLEENSAGVLKITDGSTGAGSVQTKSVQYITGAKPTCDVTTRGTEWYVAGGAGVADTVEMCGKSVADTYSWVALGTF